MIIIVVRLFLPLSYMYTHLPRFSRSGPCSAILATDLMNVIISVPPTLGAIFELWEACILLLVAFQTKLLCFTILRSLFTSVKPTISQSFQRGTQYNSSS